jgi:YHS domain-containing protein
MNRDLVCGMYVNEEYARLTGKTAAYGNKTYYFCMEECRDSFTKEPEKYSNQKALEGEHEHRAAMKMDDKSWLEMLAPGKGIHVIKRSGTFPGQDMKRTIGTPAGSGDVIDWDGPDPETPRDWSGWGKFPGAKYLGIHDEKKAAAQHDDLPDMDKDSDTEEKPSASDAAAPSTLSPDHEAMK